MTTALHAFTEVGLNRASQLLADLRSGEVSSVPATLLEASDLTVATGSELPLIGSDSLSTRWHLAIWLYKALSDASGSRARLLQPAEWSWLAMRHFDILAPVINGKRKIGEDARYLLQADDYRKAYRHLLAGPYLLFQAHSDDPASVRGLLSTKPDTPGEVYEQLASRKFLVASRAVVSVATQLYLDPSSGKPRRGAGTSGPGSPRRLSDVLQQFDKTYDMQSMSRETLLSLLPQEFTRFAGQSD